MNRFLIGAITVIFVAALVIGSWFGLRWVATVRADNMLTSANRHIEAANQVMDQVKVEQLSQESFTSLDNISRTGEAIQAMKPLLGQAALEVTEAEDDAGSAAGLPFLTGWYSEYLQKKQESAAVRRQQLDVLAATADRLEQLYAAGPDVYSSIQEMDRLFGQFQAAMGKVQSSPSEAGAILGQVTQSFRDVQIRLDQAYAQTAFEMLPALSKAAAENAELSALAGQLADAAGAGDQAAAQQVAALLEEKLLTTSTSSNAIDSWWQQQITPLQQEYADLQARQEVLDAEAVELYSRIRSVSAN
jgi:hypothetical protein